MSNSYKVKLGSDRSKAAAAGLIGGSTATLLLHPLDLLKTRQAIYCGSRDEVARSRYSKVTKAFREIVQKEGGLRGLYAGLGSNMLLSGTSWGIYFVSYSTIKQGLTNISTFQDNGLANGASAVGAGVVTTLITNPLSVVRTRLVGETTNSKAYSGIGSALKHIVKTEGISAMYKGLGPSIVNVSHGAIQFVLYEKAKEYIQQGPQPTTTETLMASSVSKMMAALVTYPCQNLRARQQASTAMTASTFTSVMKQEGLRGLYKGVVPYLLHVVPNVCVVFMVYEAVAGGRRL